MTHFSMPDLRCVRDEGQLGGEQDKASLRMEGHQWKRDRLSHPVEHLRSFSGLDNGLLDTTYSNSSKRSHILFLVHLYILTVNGSMVFLIALGLPELDA